MAAALSAPLLYRVLTALVNLLGRFVGIALPSQLKDFNLSMTYMLRLVVVLAAALSITDFDVAASVVLLALYITAAEALEWQFPDHAVAGVTDEVNAGADQSSDPTKKTAYTS